MKVAAIIFFISTPAFLFSKCHSDFDSDFWISISTIIIAILAFFLSIWNHRQTRNHNRLSVRPYLSTGTRFYISGQNGLFLSNRGIGPAIIKSITISYKGSRYDFGNNNEIQRFYDKFLTGITLNYTRIGKGSVLLPNQEEPLLSTSFDQSYSQEQIKLIEQITNDIRIACVYESLYKEEFSREM